MGVTELKILVTFGVLIAILLYWYQLRMRQLRYTLAYHTLFHRSDWKAMLVEHDMDHLWLKVEFDRVWRAPTQMNVTAWRIYNPYCPRLIKQPESVLSRWCRNPLYFTFRCIDEVRFITYEPVVPFELLRVDKSIVWANFRLHP